MTTGKVIKERRKELGISAEELAAAVGISAATEYRYESGAIEKLPGNRIEAIARALHTTPQALMGWDESPAPSGDAELDEYLEMLRTRPECRMLMSTVKGATKAQVEENVKFIEVLRALGK